MAVHGGGRRGEDDLGAGRHGGADGEPYDDGDGADWRQDARESPGRGRRTGRFGSTAGASGDDPLIRVCDLAGRPRGTGFLADGDGTLVTSHEAVDGLARLVLHAPGGQVCLAESEAVTALPESGLALVATEGLAAPPLAIGSHGPAHPERRVRLRIPHRAEGTVVGATAVTYTATDRFHLLGEVYELALDDADLNRAVPQASGTPLIDAATGAVLGVVAIALHAGHRASGFAIPLTAAGAPRPLAELLERNAATVPAYGSHLNLAGALQLTGTSVGAAAGPGEWREPVTRDGVTAELRRFLAADGLHAPLVLGLVGEPGTGRSTELAQLAARRARGPRPAPTLWLRGAELRPGDGGLKDAVERSLRTAARIVGAGRLPNAAPAPLWPAAGIADPSPDAVADLARAAGRPLLVLLDAPEEMPPVLAHALADWTAGTASWLRAGRARLVVACRPEFWEQAGALLPRELLYAGSGQESPGGSEERRQRSPRRPAARHIPFRELPPCLRLDDLSDDEAARARARYGLRPGDPAEPDAAHPLALRLLAEITAALPEELDPPEGEPRVPPSRVEVFSAHLDLVCLRIAVRLAAASEPPLRGTGVRRLAARVAGQVHEAARRSLGPGQGELDREAFEELFPWRTGWASAVLTEGLLVPAGAGYRFAHEEAADWLQALHLDLPAALYALVHRWFAPAGGPAEAPVRLPSRPTTRAGQPPPVPPAPAVAPTALPRSLPVPHHRAGPVVQALLLSSPATLAAHLQGLVSALAEPATTPSRCSPRPPALPGPGTGSTGVPRPTSATGRPGTGVGSTSVGVSVPRPGAGRSPALGDGGDGGTSGAASGAEQEPQTSTVPFPARAAGEGASPAPGAGKGPTASGTPSPCSAAREGRSSAVVPESGWSAGEGSASGARDEHARGTVSCPPPGVSEDLDSDTVPNPRTRRAARPDAVCGQALGGSHGGGPTDGQGGGGEACAGEGMPEAAPGTWKCGRGEDAGAGAGGSRGTERHVGRGTGGSPTGGEDRATEDGMADDAGSVGPSSSTGEEDRDARAGEARGPGELPGPGGDAGGGGTGNWFLGAEWPGEDDGDDETPERRAAGGRATSGGAGLDGLREAGRIGGVPGPGTHSSAVDGSGAEPAGGRVPEQGGRGRRGGPDGPHDRASGSGAGGVHAQSFGGGGRALGSGWTPGPVRIRGGDRDPHRGGAGRPYGPEARRRDAVWWAAHLLREALLRVPDARPYREVLQELAGQIVVRSVAAGGFGRLEPEGLGAFGPWFWRRVPLPATERLELLRMLLPADGPPYAAGRDDRDDRFLTVVAELLREEPAEAMPAVCGWFADDRPLQGEPRLTVASAAQALLHTHRRLSVDDLTDALVAAGRPAADEVLTALAEDEPSALCRAVDRWAHDPRPDRHVAAATYGARTVPHVRSDADRELLRYAALAILARPDDCTLHGAALGLLVRDQATRARHLPAALRHFTDGDPSLPPGAVAAALTTHPEPVLAAFRTRFRGGGDSAEALRALAAVHTPALARRTAVLVEDHLRHRPGQAAAVAGYLDLRLEQGPAVRPVLLPLAAALLRDHPPQVRAALVPVFAAPGSHMSRALRQELLETVLETERDPDVLDALLTAAADGALQRHPLLTRDLVHQLALLFVRTPDGASRFDRRIVQLAVRKPAFAAMVREWLADTQIWDTLIGPSARRTLMSATRLPVL